MNPIDRAKSPGLLHWLFPAILALSALDVLLTNRDLTQLFLHLAQAGDAPRPPLMAWAQRGVSVLLLVAAVEQIANHIALRRPMPSPMLLAGFIVYWVGTIGIPMVAAANPGISHEYVYSLVFGSAICLVGPTEHARILRSARDGLFLLMLAGLALIPFKTHMVLDTSYNQGLIPGLPRFGGLTSHPVTQGMLAQIALLVLWCMPYQRRWLNRAAWVLGLVVLYIAQSKTAWVAFAACGLVLLAVRHGGAFWRRVSNPRDGSFGVLICVLLMVGVFALAAWVVVGDAIGDARDFAASPEGAQLLTLTGRDRIWAAALEEWHRNPVFGYGLSIWDASYRLAIGIPNATHAHNQLLDDLARSGSVGGFALLLYACVLLALALRGARASGGLSLALFTAIALRCVSEVPLSLLGYGPEVFTHLLMLATLAAASAQRQASRPQPASLRFGVVS